MPAVCNLWHDICTKYGMLTIKRELDAEIKMSRIGDEYILSLHISTNRMGILYAITAAMYVRGWNILKAQALTAEGEGILDTFIIEPTDSIFTNPLKTRRLMSDLKMLIRGEVAVPEYIEQNLPRKKTALTKKAPRKRLIQINKSKDARYWEISVETDDRPGLLFDITRLLYLTYFDIVKLDSDTRRGRAYDRIVVCREPGMGDIDDDHTLRQSISKII